MDTPQDAAEASADHQASPAALPPLVLAVGPELTIAQAAEVQAQWLETLAEMTSPVSLDLSEVSAIDSAGVQLLLALNRSMVERGLTLHLSGHSTVVRSAFEVYGLDTRLQPVWTEAH